MDKTKQSINTGDGREPRFSRPQYSFAGPDFTIWAYFPKTNSTGDGVDLNTIQWGNLQTVTTSMSSSLSAVEQVGSSSAVDHTRGQKTYAGSLIFTVINKDPLKEILSQDMRGHMDFSPDFLTVDQLPPFNIVIETSSELLQKSSDGAGPVGQSTKVITGVRIMQYGETISIDDMFLEQSHTYTATYVSPWMEGAFDQTKVKPTRDVNEARLVEAQEVYRKNNYATEAARLRQGVKKNSLLKDTTKVKAPDLDTIVKEYSFAPLRPI